MSRIGKKPVELPSGVSAAVSGQTIEVKGPKGARTFTATDDVTLSVNDNVVTIEPRGKSKRARQQWGMAPMAIIEFVDRDTAAKGAADKARLEAAEAAAEADE